MANNAPIGLFDSGIGGTSIWREINTLLPGEDTIYLADSKNAPYGQKPKKTILQLSIKNTMHLMDLGCKIIVVACNTATTNAIKELRERFDVPFIGIEPAIKPAASHSETQVIGILATQGTLNSALFHKAVATYSNISVVEQIGHGLVELIEEGNIDSEEMNLLLRSYLEPMIEKNIDYLVLGCSHYPYLIPQIKKILPSNIKIIDSGEAVARQTHNVLTQKNALSDKRQGNSIFYTNAEPKVLQNIVGRGFSVTKKDF